LKSAEERQGLFAAIERRFARQARTATVLAGATGLYMVAREDLWPSFLDPRFWWLSAMVLLWLLFTAILFLAEPLFLGRWLAALAQRTPERGFALLQRMHWALLLLSLVTVMGAVAGTHGLFLN